MNRINLTTPIYYANGKPHLGHTYTILLADTYKKFFQLLNYDVRLCTGTDEHGLKIQNKANEENILPIDFVDTISQDFKNCWKELGIDIDDFIRTTELRHKNVAQEIWEKLVLRGDIYLGEYSGLYCIGCEQYYNKSELLEGDICPVHETVCNIISEESYFFKLSKYQKKLIDHIHNNENFILPKNRRNEILGFLENNILQDLSISRTSFKWGIEVPNDTDHVMYVWFDALINYISSLGGIGSEDFNNYWNNTIQFIGKDILRFHAIYWSCMLFALDLPLPKSIVVHGFLMISDKKISKSSPVTKVNPVNMIKDIQSDGLRFFL